MGMEWNVCRFWVLGKVGMTRVIIYVNVLYQKYEFLSFLMLTVDYTIGYRKLQTFIDRKWVDTELKLSVFQQSITIFANVVIIFSGRAWNVNWTMYLVVKMKVSKVGNPEYPGVNNRTDRIPVVRQDKYYSSSLT